MSVCNVRLVAPDRVIAATDCENAVSLPTGDVAKLPCSKMFPIGHVPAILAGRGLLTTIACAAANVAIGVPLEPASLTAIDADVRRAGGGNGEGRTTTVVLAAWDASANRFTLRRWDQTPDHGFAEVPAGDDYCAPWDTSLSTLGDPKDAESMAALVQAQLRLLREKAPAAAGGGKIVFAMMVPTGITVRHLGTAS